MVYWVMLDAVAQPVLVCSDGRVIRHLMRVEPLVADDWEIEVEPTNVVPFRKVKK
jgi:hypothetical protein